MFSRSAPMQPKKPTMNVTQPAMRSSITGLTNISFSIIDASVSLCVSAQLLAAINRTPFTWHTYKHNTASH